MGLFDHVRCRYPLPDPEGQELDFQTKSFAEQRLDDYELTRDGLLMHEAHDVRFEENAEAPLGFYIHRDNPRWEFVDFTDELEIHTSTNRDGPDGLWWSYVIEPQGGRVVGLQHGPGHGVPLPKRK